MSDSCEGYTRWVELKGSPEEYAERGCIVRDDGCVELQAGDACEDVTPLVDEMVERLPVIFIPGASG